MRPLLSIALALALCGVARPSSAQKAEDAYHKAREDLQLLLRDDKRKQFRDSWNRVIQALDKAAFRLPAGELRCAAWFNGARAYMEMSKISYLASDRDEAARRYRSVADRCAASNLADDALYRVGELFLERDPPRARSALSDLIRRFPKGDMVPLARDALAAIPVERAKPAGEEPKAVAHGGAGAAKPAPVEAPAPRKDQEEVPGAHLPSAVDILAAMDGGLEEGRLEALEKSIGGEMPLSVVAGLKVKRVVIDPGHGGKDTGAIGAGGVKEKDLTLSMARRLKKHLEAMGLEVLLTREKDVTLSLEDRTRFANEKGADLFLSIHVNAAHHGKAFGIETYTLNLNSDRYAMRLAARENATSNRRIGDLQFILADLATKANTDDSVHLAKAVQQKMIGRLRAKHGSERIRDLGVKQALFFVLVGARMPAVLLETGFISNKDELARLRSEAYQEEAMRGVADGVRQFILDREAIATGKLPGGAGGVF